MSQREKILAFAVAAIIGLVGLQWVFSSATKVLDEKNSALDDAVADSDMMDAVVLRGTRAAKQLKSLKERSLPSDPETAIAQYRDWLTQLGNSVDMEGIFVSQPSSTDVDNEAYNAYRFTLRGQVALDQVFVLLGKFYDKNYIHTVRDFKMQMQENGKVMATLVSQAVALKIADKDQPPPTGSSGRLAMAIDEYKSKILNRNPFAPPNVAPSIANKSVDVVVGRALEHTLETKDPEGHQTTLKMVSIEDAPEGLELDNDTLLWTPDEPGRHEIKFEVADIGWPSASREETVVINVKEMEQEVEEPEFDITTQAFISGLTSGREGRKVWIRSRIDGQSFTLGEGDDFELGRLQAKVISINLEEDFAEMETGGIRWIVDMDTSLAEAYQRSLDD